MVSQPNLFKRLLRPFSALFARNAGKSERKLHICYDALVRNQIVTLKNKSHGVVSVRIPLFIKILFCGYAVNQQIAVRISVQTADYI